jgi:hypothetical protein
VETPFGRHSTISDDNIQRYSKMGCEGVYWIRLPQGGIQWEAVVNMAVHFRVL